MKRISLDLLNFIATTPARQQAGIKKKPPRYDPNDAEALDAWMQAKGVKMPSADTEPQQDDLWDAPLSAAEIEAYRAMGIVLDIPAASLPPARKKPGFRIKHRPQEGGSCQED